MSWWTNRFVMQLRNTGRALGINRMVANMHKSSAYEAQYDRQFSSHLRSGDCVWDVGANVGLYTCAFSKKVGPGGVVYAFEPSRANFARLSQRCGAMENVRLMPLGLGSSNQSIGFRQGVDDLGATSRVIDAPAVEDSVEIRSGDSLIAEGLAAEPDALKIDVEGYEWEVLQGIGNALSRQRIALVGVEVHFGILNERRMSFAAREIERLLVANGFSTNWADSSHILGSRHR